MFIDGTPTTVGVSFLNNLSQTTSVFSPVGEWCYGHTDSTSTVHLVFNYIYIYMYLFLFRIRKGWPSKGDSGVDTHVVAVRENVDGDEHTDATDRREQEKRNLYE